MILKIRRMSSLGRKAGQRMLCVTHLPSKHGLHSEATQDEGGKRFLKIEQKFRKSFNPNDTSYTAQKGPQGTSGLTDGISEGYFLILEINHR